MAEEFSGMPYMNDRTFKSMNCSEVEALAEVLRLAGYSDLADAIIDDHAAGDNEEDDLHYQQGEE